MFPTCTLLGVRLESLPAQAEATYFLMMHTSAAKKALLSHRAGGVGQLHQPAAAVCTGLPLKLPHHTAKSWFSGLEFPERRNIGGRSCQKPGQVFATVKITKTGESLVYCYIIMHKQNYWASPTPRRNLIHGKAAVPLLPHCLPGRTCCA